MRPGDPALAFAEPFALARGLASSLSSGGGAAPLVAPAFTLQPVGVTVTEPTAVALTAAASGNPTPTLQWRKGGVNIGGATSSPYNINPSAVADSGSYDCVATNSQGSATSSAAVVTVNAASGFGFTTLSWPAPSGATSQRIYLSTTTDGQSVVGTLTNSPTQQYRDLAAGATNAVITGLPSAGTWYYKTTATNAGGESDQSQEASGTAV
jgi:hypothetical protein